MWRLTLHVLLVVHQNETMACRSTARQLRHGGLRGCSQSTAQPALAVLGYFRRAIAPGTASVQ